MTATSNHRTFLDRDFQSHQITAHHHQARVQRVGWRPQPGRSSFLFNFGYKQDNLAFEFLATNLYFEFRADGEFRSGLRGEFQSGPRAPGLTDTKDVDTWR